MSQNIMHKFLALLLPAMAVMTGPSCVYDGNYWGPAPGGAVAARYSTGYGWGYGYGNPGFNSSVFVSTGNARWGYDPFCQSYFDFHRNCYYDPFLFGYYPLGYRPAALVGVPHPLGWRNGFCPPPRVVRDVRFANYQNRATAYRSSRYDWARQVRPRPVNPRTVDTRPSGNSNRPYQRFEESRPSGSRPFYGGPSPRGRIDQGGRSPSNPGYSRGNTGSGNGGRATQGRRAQTTRNSYSMPVSRQNSGGGRQSQSFRQSSPTRNVSSGRSGNGNNRNQSTRTEEKRNRR